MDKEEERRRKIKKEQAERKKRIQRKEFLKNLYSSRHKTADEK